jgi:hypothetical protein
MMQVLGVDPEHCVYLDDLGINLKLEALVGFPLR